jgi:hypothetical protein
MTSLGNLLLILTSYGACIGLCITYPFAGFPLTILLVYATILNFKENRTK